MIGDWKNAPTVLISSYNAAANVALGALTGNTLDPVATGASFFMPRHLPMMPFTSRPTASSDYEVELMYAGTFAGDGLLSAIGNSGRKQRYTDAQ